MPSSASTESGARTVSVGPPAVLASLVRRLVLRDFRSYAALDCAIGARLVVLMGENGAGKTNILEALSLFSPGRGLRGAEIGECARRQGAGGFAVSIEIEAEDHRTQLGHGLEPGGDGPPQRRFRIDREPVASARAFADHLRVAWLTPSMDGLFAGSPGDRRKFLDRLALSLDPQHGARVVRFERSLRNRNRLLEDRPSDHRWLDAAEREISALGVAVAAARRLTVTRLRGLIEEGLRDHSPFPWAEVAVEGELERMLGEEPALRVEESYRAILAASRRQDRAAGRTLRGPQASDLAVRHGAKGEPARACSTGEQKALLVGLVLAHARLVASMSGAAPLLLLDEVAAHFDPHRRDALFEELDALGGQVFMTGADPKVFGSLQGAADILRVTPGQIESCDPSLLSE